MGDFRVQHHRSDPRQSCYRKVPNNEKAALRQAAKVNAREGAEVVRAYGCTHCGNWHIGRAPGVIGEPTRRSHGPRPPEWRHRGRGVD